MYNNDEPLNDNNQQPPEQPAVNDSPAQTPKRDAPQYGAQPPQYGTPQPPQYGAPRPPQYGAPQQPQYGAPQPPQYGAPQYQYGAPQQYGAPYQNGFPRSAQYAPPQYPYSSEEISVPGKGLGIAGMVLGICSIVFSCLWYFGLPCAIVGLVLSAVGYSKAKKVNMKNSMALAGIVLSAISLALDILVATVFASIFSEAFNSLFEEFQYSI